MRLGLFHGAALLVLAACTAGPPAARSPSDAPSPSPTASEPTEPPAVPSEEPTSPASPDARGAELVLRVDNVGGLGGPGGPAVQLTRVPIWSLYAEGSVITPGAQIAIYPGPALPNLQLTRISPAAVPRIVEEAADAGLLSGDRVVHSEGIADATATVFTITSDGETHVTTVEALYEAPADTAERASIQGFLNRLTDLRTWLGTDVAPTDVPYEWAVLRIVAEAADPAEAPEPELVQIVDWPLVGSLAEFGEPVGAAELRCGVLSGTDLQDLRPLLDRANELTHWRSDGETYRLGFRPLLPDEEGCAVDS